MRKSDKREQQRNDDHDDNYGNTVTEINKQNNWIIVEN